MHMSYKHGETQVLDLKRPLELFMLKVFLTFKGLENTMLHGTASPMFSVSSSKLSLKIRTY